MKKGLIALIAALLIVPAATLTQSTPSPPPGAAPSPGAPAPASFSLGGSCPQVIGPAPSQTSALANWISSFPKGSSITFPHDACYITNGPFRLAGLKNLAINGNGSTFTQTVPGLNGGSDTTECGHGQRFFLVASSGVSVSNLNFVGAWSGDAGFDSDYISTSATQTFGTILLTGAGTTIPAGKPSPISHISVGDLVNGPGMTHASGFYYYITSVNTATNSVTYTGTGTGVPGSGGTFEIHTNGGVHCESFNGVELQGNSHVTLSGLNVSDIQGDGLSIQLPTDGSIKGNPVNTYISISGSVWNGQGYDGISEEASNHVTFTNNLFEGASENTQDMEVDNADTSFDPTGNCQFACQSNILFTRNTFEDNAGNFLTSPQGACPGVQQQNVTFASNTIINPGSGIHIQGTTQPGCQIVTTFPAQSVGTNGCGGHGPGGGACPTIITHATPVANQNAIVTGTNLVGLWKVYIVLPPSHTIILYPGAGGTGTPVTGGTYNFVGPATASAYLTIGLTFENNLMEIGSGQFSGFNALFGSDPACGEPMHNACPQGFAMQFNGVNQITMTNNQFFIENANAPPATNHTYIAVIDNHDVNTEVIKNNDFTGAYALFNNDNHTSTGIVDCGNTWSHTPFNDGSC